MSYIYKKIIVSILFLLASPIYAAQQYMMVICSSGGGKEWCSYTDPNTGKRSTTDLISVALSKVPLNYKLEAHNSANNGVFYLFKQT